MYEEAAPTGAVFCMPITAGHSVFPYFAIFSTARTSAFASSFVE